MNFMISILINCKSFCVDYFKKGTIRELVGTLAQLVEQFTFNEWMNEVILKYPPIKSYEW